MALRAMEEEVLWKAQVLNEKRLDLCRCLTPKEHYPYLRSKYILSRDDEEFIESQKTTKEKVHVLIEILMKKVPQGFDEMVKSLIQEKTQVHLAEMLNKEFENKRRKCYSNHNHISKTQSAPSTSSQSSISDLGVDTDKLPKPQHPRQISKEKDLDLEKDNDRKKDSEKDIILELEPASKFDSKESL